MFDIREWDIKDLQFRTHEAEIIAIYDLKELDENAHNRVLVIFRTRNGIDIINVTATGRHRIFSTLDIILKPKKTLHVKTVLDLLKQYSLQSTPEGLVYNGNKEWMIIHYHLCGKPTEEKLHSPEFIKLFCEYKEENK